MSVAVDQSRCPLCGTENLCAIELAMTTGEAQGECWCMQADFSLAPMDKLPASARGLACICARCAAGQTREKNPLS
ncbi:MAG: hypothetical protein EOP78_12215 [Variovorax sp.]|nr:MAG: hypothetical protein EOP78_12215 [Variovorax sp.]